MKPSQHRCIRRIRSFSFSLGLALVVAGCTSLSQQTTQLALEGRYDEVVSVLQERLAQTPNDQGLRIALENAKEDSLNFWANKVERELQAGRTDAARELLDRAAALDVQPRRMAQMRERLELLILRDARFAEAQQAFAQGNFEQANAGVNAVLAQTPTHAAARQLKRRLRDVAEANQTTAATLGPQFQKLVNLEFREASFRTVMDALAQSTGVSFVFDPEVKADTKMTVQLKQVSIDEALKIVLSTQRLERKVLSESTLLIYPDVADKRKVYQDFIMRTFYLSNSAIGPVANMVRAIAKPKDLFTDERLNLIVVRDTPEIVKLVERLIESADLAEPEVMLEVEILEVSNQTSQQLGIQWPGSISYGVTGTATQITDGSQLQTSIANPALLATLRATSSKVSTLANPRLRVRNREKAKVMIGEKLPVFTTTSGTNTGVATSVSYLDVGLKLDVEPTVMLDNDVLLKIGLEVSSVTGKVNNGQGTTAYQIGARQAASTLVLQDGETQILAGLIRDDANNDVSGLPGLSKMPGLGRLFGLHTDASAKTELVLLITPRVIRNIKLPDVGATNGPAGSEASPGAQPFMLNPKASAKVSLSGSSPNASGSVRTLAPRNSGNADMSRQPPPFQGAGSAPSSSKAAEFPGSFIADSPSAPNSSP